MRRREFIAGLSSAAALPLQAHTQQSRPPVIGFLSSGSPEPFAPRLRAFREGLAEAGYVEGRNVTVEYRWAHGRNERLPELADDLVRRGVTVIAALGGTPTTQAAKDATTIIPIVFFVGLDPVEFGIVASMNRPGGNLTGVASLNVELIPKRIELLRELVPTATAMTMLVNPINTRAAEKSVGLARDAASNFGLKLHVLNATTDDEIEAAFAKASGLRPDPLVIATDAVFNTKSQWLGVLAIRHAMPASFQFREFAAGGGLLSYGSSFTAPFRPAGVYVGRVLNGEKPADLPIQQATTVELIINLKTARALGISVPLPLLGRADEVIE